MRLLSSLSLCLTVGSSVLADEPPAAQPAHADAPLAAYAPLRAVGVMVATRQALFWDDVSHDFQLGKLGQDVEGWRLISIDAAQIVLEQAGARDVLTLAASDQIVLATTPPAPPVVALASDDPPAQPQPLRLPPVVVPPPHAADVMHLEKIVLRVVLDRELGDFNRLMSGLSVAPADGGGFSITRLTPDSWVASLGLVQGDVVRAVAGERISSVDDAARVYARLANMTSFVIEADRPAPNQAPEKLLVNVEIK